MCGGFYVFRTLPFYVEQVVAEDLSRFEHDTFYIWSCNAELLALP